MTAAELTCEVLDRRNITVKDKEYWNCWEVSDKEEMGEKITLFGFLILMHFAADGFYLHRYVLYIQYIVYIIYRLWVSLMKN